MCVRYDSCVDTMFEPLNVDNKSVHPFKQRQVFWFQRDKSYKSPKNLSNIIDPPVKVIKYMQASNSYACIPATTV